MRFPNFPFRATVVTVAREAIVTATHVLAAGIIGVFVADQTGVHVSVSALTALTLAAFAAAGVVVARTIGADLLNLSRGLGVKAKTSITSSK